MKGVRYRILTDRTTTGRVPHKLLGCLLHFKDFFLEPSARILLRLQIQFRLSELCVCDVPFSQEFLSRLACASEREVHVKMLGLPRSAPTAVLRRFGRHRSARGTSPRLLQLPLQRDTPTTSMNKGYPRRSLGLSDAAGASVRYKWCGIASRQKPLSPHMHLWTLRLPTNQGDKDELAQGSTQDMRRQCRQTPQKSGLRHRNRSLSRYQNFVRRRRLAMLRKVSALRSRAQQAAHHHLPVPLIAGQTNSTTVNAKRATQSNLLCPDIVARSQDTD
jgi:hypothetical protein